MTIDHDSTKTDKNEASTGEEVVIQMMKYNRRLVKTVLSMKYQSLEWKQ